VYARRADLGREDPEHDGGADPDDGQAGEPRHAPGRRAPGRASGKRRRGALRPPDRGREHVLFVRGDAEAPPVRERQLDRAERVLDRTRALLKASETGTPFEQKYDAALQAEPEIVFAHRAVIEAANGK